MALRRSGRSRVMIVTRPSRSTRTVTVERPSLHQMWWSRLTRSSRLVACLDSMSNTPSGSQATSPNDPALDPVRVKRARIAKWTLLANRVGYLFVALAMALFFMAFLFGFTSVMATLVIMSLVIGCVLLAPSIILGYAVKAADRDDRERGL